MARDFGGDSGSDEVSIPNYAAIEDISTISISVWLFRTGTDGSRIQEKRSGGAQYSLQSGAENQFASDWTTTTGVWTAPLTALNAWEHLLLTYDDGSVSNDPNFYNAGVLQSETETATPVGSPGSANGVLRIGNRSALNRAYDGALAEFTIYNQILNQNEATALASGVHSTRVRNDAIVLYVPMNQGLSPEPNYASVGDNGTVASTTVRNHAPVIPYSLRFWGHGPLVEAAAAAEEFSTRHYPRGVMRGEMRGAA